MIFLSSKSDLELPLQNRPAVAIGRNFAETDAGLRRPREKSEEEEEEDELRWGRLRQSVSQ